MCPVKKKDSEVYDPAGGMRLHIIMKTGETLHAFSGYKLETIDRWVRVTAKDKTIFWFHSSDIQSMKEFLSVLH